MSDLSTAEFQRLTLISAGVDPSQIPPILDTATWRRMLIAAINSGGGGGGGGGGGIPDAPSDGDIYGRKDGAWAKTFRGQNELAIFSGSTDGTTPLGTLLGYSNGDHTAEFSNFPGDACNPIVPIGGAKLTTLSFTSCGSYGFTLSDTSGLTALTTLSFSGCGSYGFTLSDTSGLTALTTLSFSGCGGFGGFTLSDTSGLTALTSLSFSGCGGFGFSLPDTSGLTALTTLSFNDCGSYDFSIQDSTSLLPEAMALIILNAVDNGTGNGVGPITLHVTGTSTLQTVKTSLEGKGYTVTLTTP